MQYSRCGRTRVLYKFSITSGVFTTNVLFIKPNILFAFRQTSLHWDSTFKSVDIITPKSRSVSQYLQLMFLLWQKLKKKHFSTYMRRPLGCGQAGPQVCRLAKLRQAHVILICWRQQAGNSCSSWRCWSRMTSAKDRCWHWNVGYSSTQFSFIISPWCAAVPTDMLGLRRWQSFPAQDIKWQKANSLQFMAMYYSLMKIIVRPTWTCTVFLRIRGFVHSVILPPFFLFYMFTTEALTMLCFKLPVLCLPFSTQPHQQMPLCASQWWPCLICWCRVSDFVLNILKIVLTSYWTVKKIKLK